MHAAASQAAAVERERQDRPATATTAKVKLEAVEPRVLAYMRQIQPAEPAVSAETGPSVREHLTEAPTLLPMIKFQDLIFGQDLGSGSFSTVRFCKRIVRGTSASTWPEYAAKVLSARLITELGYKPALKREIAVLRQLKHPSIARLATAFRWRGDVYLLLEYAAGGDLHTALCRHGSLALATARFIFAEVCLGLSQVHQLGYAFGDLKPENILLTASGHAKLTDFGAARPLEGAVAAAEAIAAAHSVIEELHDGDWRSSVDTSHGGGVGPTSPCCRETPVEPDEALDPVADRLEGTAAYMSPELARREGRPSIASDCWALGCSLHQALAGRPYVWADTAREMLRKLVTFEGLSEIRLPDDYDEGARSILQHLLKVDSKERLGNGAAGVGEVMAHRFFESLGDVSDLYQRAPPRLAVGVVTPQPNAAWTRRQNSMMWSPLPQRYCFGANGGSDALAPLVELTEEESHLPFVTNLIFISEIVPP